MKNDVWKTCLQFMAQNLADKIVFINQGEILEQGTKDIMINPKTSQFKKFLMSLENVIITNNNIE